MTSVTFRCDDATEGLLNELALPGENRSETIRRALHDARRFRRRERMRVESLALGADADDRAEAAAVQAELAAVRAR